MLLLLQCKIILSSFQNAEVVVVVSDPSGKSLNTEVWDAGSFETKTEGRKIYTRKVRFEYNKGEPKQLIFSLEPENFEKGIYKISLYHNGFASVNQVGNLVNFY